MFKDKPLRKYLDSRTIVNLISNVNRIRMKKSSQLLKNRGILLFATRAEDFANVYKMLVIGPYEQDRIASSIQRNIRFAISFLLLKLNPQLGIRSLRELYDVLSRYSGTWTESRGREIAYVNTLTIESDKNGEKEKIVIELQYTNPSTGRLLDPLRLRVYAEIIQISTDFIVLIGKERFSDFNTVYTFLKVVIREKERINQEDGELIVPSLAQTGIPCSELVDTLIKSMEEVEFECLGLTQLKSKNPSGTGESLFEAERLGAEGLNISVPSDIIAFLEAKNHKIIRITLCFYSSSAHDTAFEIEFGIEISKNNLTIKSFKEIEEDTPIVQIPTGEFDYKAYKDSITRNLSIEEQFKINKRILMIILRGLGIVDQKRLTD